MILEYLLNPSSLEIKQQLDLKGAVIVKNFLNKDSINKISYEYDKFLNDHINFKFKSRFSDSGTNGLRMYFSYKDFQKKSKIFSDLIIKSNIYTKDCTNRKLSENSKYLFYLHSDNEKILYQKRPAGRSWSFPGRRRAPRALCRRARAPQIGLVACNLWQGRAEG